LKMGQSSGNPGLKGKKAGGAGRVRACSQSVLRKNVKANLVPKSCATSRQKKGQDAPGKRKNRDEKKTQRGEGSKTQM